MLDAIIFVGNVSNFLCQSDCDSRRTSIIIILATFDCAGVQLVVRVRVFRSPSEFRSERSEKGTFLSCLAGSRDLNRMLSCFARSLKCKSQFELTSENQTVESQEFLRGTDNRNSTATTEFHSYRSNDDKTTLVSFPLPNHGISNDFWSDKCSPNRTDSLTCSDCEVQDTVVSIKYGLVSHCFLTLS
jgi:hypothetical protein